jgi:hypothetical protein
LRELEVASSENVSVATPSLRQSSKAATLVRLKTPKGIFWKIFSVSSADPWVDSATLNGGQAARLDPGASQDPLSLFLLGRAYRLRPNRK